MGYTTQITLSCSYSDLFDMDLKPLQKTSEDALYEMAVYEMDQDRMINAARILDRILIRDNQHVDALFDRGLILHEEGHYKRSSELLERVIAMDPTQLEAYQLLAHNYIQLNNIAEAKSVLYDLYIINGDSTTLELYNAL